jgi:hypothetical protein
MSDRVYQPYWKNVRGEAGHYQNGAYFDADQGEYWQLSGRWATIEAQIRIVELEDYTWLADSCAYHDEPRYQSREEALRAAVERVAQHCRWAVDAELFDYYPASAEEFWGSLV